MARYCSQFCQHKDWESHHKICSNASDAIMPTKRREEEEGDDTAANEEGNNSNEEEEDGNKDGGDDDDSVEVSRSPKLIRNKEAAAEAELLRLSLTN